MKGIPAPFLADLAADVRTVATCWKITRTDGQVFGFTDHDASLLVSGQIYDSVAGYTASAFDSSDDMSTANMEVNALFNSESIQEEDIEAGLWDLAVYQIFLVNYMAPSHGIAILSAGTLGEFTLQNGQYTAELRGLAQIMQQSIGQIYSPTCRATLGDNRCLFDISTVTFSGEVSSVVSQLVWDDPTLTQAGPVVPLTDTVGSKIPTTGALSITPTPPTGGSWQSNISVLDVTGAVMRIQDPTTPPANLQDGEYILIGDTYTFSSADAGNQVFINYNYSIGYFAYGFVKWLTGQNKGYSMEIKAFSPGVVTLSMPMLFPIAVGDTYTIVAGCDRTPGTCIGRYNNIIHFRGEQYVPGIDTILKPQGS